MTALTCEQRLCDLPEPAKVTAGLDAIVDRCIGLGRRRPGVAAELRAQAEEVEAVGGKFRDLSEAALRARLEEFRQMVRRHRRLPRRQLAEALAAVREGAERCTGLRPFVVQLMGALALHRGDLAEMATGEGKSLTAGLASILAGWTGRPCHVVTVNDYLAQRDAEALRPLYEFCGLRAGCVTGTMPPRERSHGYAADVTYTTSKEIVADFLRDRLCLGELQNGTRWMIRQLWKSGDATRPGVVMRGLHTAIVDEADSVLIDEAGTPLIISGAAGNDGSQAAYQLAWTLASQLQAGSDYRVAARYRDLELLPAGAQRIASQSERLPGLWRASARQRELIGQALQAREFFHAGKQYVVQDGKVVIVDEFTGRMMPMRKWRHGLHQAIEAKEGVEISPLDETLARISFQRFFRSFRRLSGMTGTAREAAAEFWHIYRLPVVAIPPNRPCMRRELPDRVFPDAEAKWAAVAGEIARLHETGRPVLVGTRSIAASELLAEGLAARGLSCEVLNATRHLEEAQIIAGAGERGRITIATNMAGRGTDIKLGPGVVALGGLHVLATERHESRRIDRQLFGRAGRQGDPGSAQSLVSAQDELLVRFAAPVVQRTLAAAVRQRLPMSGRLAKLVLAQAQGTAQRQAFRQRRQVLELDSWLAEALSFASAR
ncbi:MAG: preprotein translocase subunit SecA [Chthoniobacter sp.]|jgi:preprotein translocase subunit SecA|nr:preprotein translocase subunit SecA [Chthoniobacter sp.]